MFHESGAIPCKHTGATVCEYRHRDLTVSTADRSLCPDWVARGAGLPSCPRGADCPFTHPSMSVINLYDCARYLTGGRSACNADTCWLRHSRVVADAVKRGVAKVCTFWPNSVSCRAKCAFVHPTGRTPDTMTMYGFEFLKVPPGPAPPPAPVPPPPPEPAPPSPVVSSSTRRRVFVAWDIENAPLPRGAVVSRVMGTLREMLAGVLGLGDEMVMDTMAFYNAHLEGYYALPDAVVKNLGVSGVLVSDVGTRKGAADFMLKDAVARKLQERADGLPLEAIVVVTGDGDFACTLRDIREEGCTEVLVVGPYPKLELVEAARNKLYWNAVLAGAAAAPRRAPPPHTPVAAHKPAAGSTGRPSPDPAALGPTAAALGSAAAAAASSAAAAASGPKAAALGPAAAALSAAAAASSAAAAAASAAAAALPVAAAALSVAARPPAAAPPLPGAGAASPAAASPLPGGARPPAAKDPSPAAKYPSSAAKYPSSAAKYTSPGLAYVGSSPGPAYVRSSPAPPAAPSSTTAPPPAAAPQPATAAPPVAAPPSTTAPPAPQPAAAAPPAAAAGPSGFGEETVWACPICTCHNRPDWLACDACGTQRHS